MFMNPVSGSIGFFGKLEAKKIMREVLYYQFRKMLENLSY